MGSPPKATDKPIGKTFKVSLTEKVSVGATVGGGTGGIGGGGGATIQPIQTPQERIEVEQAKQRGEGPTQQQRERVRQQELEPQERARKEAGEQLKRHGIKYTEDYTQKEFERLSPDAQAEILKQQEQAQRVEQIQLLTNQPTIAEPNFDLLFATEYEASKGLTLEGKRLERKGETPAEIAEYERRINFYNAFVSDYNLEQQHEYENKIRNLAGGIVKEAKEKGATKVQIYTPEGEPIGALKTEGAQEPLQYLLKTGEFQYGFTVPKTPEEKQASEKSKEEQKQFAGYLKSEQKLGASGFEVYDKEGKLVATVPDRFGIMKAQKEYGDVTVKAKFSPETVLKSYAKAPVGDPSKPLTYLRAQRGVTDMLQVTGVSLATDVALATGIPDALKKFGVYKTAEEDVIKTREKYTKPTALDPLFAGRPTEKSFEYNVAGIGTFIALNIGVFGGRRIKPTKLERIGVDIAKPVKVPQAPTLTRMYRPTNIYREQLPKDIFKFDTAETPTVSVRQPTPRNVLLEDVSKETQAKLQKGQVGLLEPAKPKPPEKEPRLPEELNPLGYRGKPPITSLTKEPLPKSRAEVVEETKLRLEHEVFTSKGRQIGKVGELPSPLGALVKIRTPKPIEGVPPEFLNPLGRRGKPPIIRLTSEELPPARAERIEFEGKLYSTKGIGALARGKKKPLEVQEVKGYKPNIREFYIRPRKIDTERLLDIERPEIGTPKDFLEALNVAKKPQAKPKPPFTPIRFEPRRFTEPEPSRRSTRPVTILITKQEPKLATKPITKLRKKREPRYAITGLYQEEEQVYLSKYRPRPAARTILITPQKPETMQRFDLQQQLGIKPTTKTTPRQMLVPAALSLQAPKIKPKQIQRFRLVPLEAGKGIPRTKAATAQAPKQAPRQLTKEILRIPPKPPRLVIPFGLSSGRKPGYKPRKEEPGLRADFLGNVRQADIEGIYKRTELTYGQKRINKLLRQDKPSRAKGRFVKESKPSSKSIYFFTKSPKESRKRLRL